MYWLAWLELKHILLSTSTTFSTASRPIVDRKSFEHTFGTPTGITWMRFSQQLWTNTPIGNAQYNIQSIFGKSIGCSCCCISKYYVKLVRFFHSIFCFSVFAKFSTSSETRHWKRWVMHKLLRQLQKRSICIQSIIANRFSMFSTIKRNLVIFHR